MGQKARPIADVANDGWAPATGYYKLLNEASPDDVGVSSPGATGFYAFVVKLRPIALPAEGTRRLRVRLRKQGPDTGYALIRLLQGDSLVAARLVQPGAGYADEAVVLTDEEMSRITDYTDLRASVGAGRPQTDCCAGPISPLLKVAFSDGVGLLAPLTGREFPLAYDGGHWGWDGESALAGGAKLTRLDLECAVTNWALDLVGTGGLAIAGNSSEQSCGPLDARGTLSGPSGSSVKWRLAEWPSP